MRREARLHFIESYQHYTQHDYQSAVDTNMSTVLQEGNTVPRRVSEAHTVHSSKSVQQVGPPGQGPGSEASTSRENTDTQFSNTSAITSPHFVSTYCKRYSVPVDVEGNEAKKDAECPSLP